MLTVVDIPEDLTKMYEQSKKLSAKIIDFIDGSGRKQEVPGNQDILGFCPGYIFINKGYFKFYKGSKLIRLYSENDSLWLQNKSNFDDCRLTCEFGSEITVFKNKNVLEAIAGNPDLLKTWLALHELDAQIMRLLCSLYIVDKVSPDIEIRNAKNGDVLIKEGDEPDKIFIMVDGKAVVTRNGKSVGTIESGEVFGELSFITNQPRTSTVTANANCLIQAMSYDDFLKIIPNRPNLIMTLSKSLSNRIVKLNKELTGK